MIWMKHALKQVDFSKETDLKERLYAQLFGPQNNVVSIGAMQLEDDDLDIVNAAGIIAPEEKDPGKKDPFAQK